MKRTDEYELTAGQRAGLYPILFLSFLIGMLVATQVMAQETSQKKPDEFCAKCAGLKTAGTTVHFADTIKDAQKYAKEHGKLVFMLHVSGNFDKEEFT